MKIKFIASVFISCFSLIGLALNETYSTRLDNVELGTVSSLEIEDGKFLEVGGLDFSDLKTTLRVKLGVDERSSYGFIDWQSNFSILITVTPYNTGGQAQSPLTQQTLTVNYDPSGFAMNLLNLENINTFVHSNNIHKYLISYTIVGGATVPENVYLEAELDIERYYEISQDRPTLGANYVFYDNAGVEDKVFGVNKGFIPTNAAHYGKELEVWWDYIPGAEEYELEWAWIDNYGDNIYADIPAGSMPFNAFDFEKNNTRIITNNQHFRIPLIYAKGFIVYRVRGVGRWLGTQTAEGIKKFGEWSSFPWLYNMSPSITVSNWNHYVTLTSTHEAIKNWQFQAVFAEEGKKKEIINYFDGSLRNRQTVTKINSNNEAIVGENVYDNQGRSAVQILPAPVGNPSLRYYPSLNKNAIDPSNLGTSVDIFTHRDFDWDEVDGSVCNPDAAPMSTEFGASKYYSSNNIVEDNWQDNVPSAEGFPYVQIEYTPDNTGRISKQSGVGETFTIDQDHATKYLYGQPYQEELNRLFGYEVGHKSRYKKNMVVDANGQVSISILDPQGRVIATALTGDATGTGLEELVYAAASAYNIDLDLLAKAGVDEEDTEFDDNIAYSSGANNTEIDGLKMTTETLNGRDNNLHGFEYQIRTGEFTDATCLPGVSFPYSYILDIDMRDICGNSKIVKFDFNDNNNSANDLDDVVNEGIHTTIEGNQNLTYSFETSLSIGSFATGKSLVVNPVRLQEYVIQYINNPSNTCIKQKSDFFIDNSDCVDDPLSVGDEVNVTSCFVSEKMLLADLSPGGQYASNDSGDKLSIFSTTTGLNMGYGNTIAAWKTPITPYKDSYGGNSYIVVTYDNVGTVFSPAIDLLITASFSDLIPIPGLPNQYKVKPEHLTNSEDFIHYWQTSWAESLLDYHPEYCYTEIYADFCEKTSVSCNSISSDDFDNELLAINTYANADLAANNFLGQSLIPSSSGVFQIKDNDPFFCLDYNELDWSGNNLSDINGLKEKLMEEVLLDYKHMNALTSSPGFTLWQIAIKAVMCSSNLSGNCTFPASLPYDISGYPLSERNEIWNTYKNLYLAEKRKIKQLFINFAAIASGCDNSYIGGNTQNSTLIQSFSDYPEFMHGGGTTPLPSNITPANYTSVYDGLLDQLDAAVQEYNSLTGPEFPWFSGATSTSRDYQYLFSDKQKRFIPIDNLYNSGLPDNTMMDAGTNQTDYAQLKALGRCPLSLDLEYFLKSLAENSQLLQTTNSNLIPQLTVDLYKNMGGTVSSSTDPVNVTGSANGNTLTINVSDPTTTNNLALSTNVVLTKSGSWNWSDVLSFSYLYYEPGSLSGGIYSFKIIVEVLESGMPKEYVIDGTTEIEIGECAIDPPCDRMIELGNNLGQIFSELVTQQNLNSSVTSSAISNYDNGWFLGSELQEQIANVSPLNTTLSNFPTGGYFSLNKNATELRVDFGSYPLLADITFISGYELMKNASSGDFEVIIYYLDQNGDNLSMTGIITKYVENILEPIEIDCGCDDDIELFKSSYKAFINQLLAGILTNGGNFVSDFYSSNLENLMGDYLEIESPSIVSYAEADESFIYELLDGENEVCKVVFDFVNPPPPGVFMTYLNNITDLEVTISPISNEVVYIKATGFFIDAQSTIHNIEIETTTINCMSIPEECEPCTPEIPEPKSCQTEFSTYETYFYDLNISVTNASGPTLFPVLTEPEFCDANLAYAASGYLYYLNNLGTSGTTSSVAIVSPHDDFYITIGEFINTRLNSGYSAINDVIDAFDNYIFDNNLTSADINWNTFVNDIYLLDIDNMGICPPPPFPSETNFTFLTSPCEPYTANIDVVNTNNQYEIYIANQITNFKQRYIKEAVNDVVENFDLDKYDKQYHYTLYYYDQAGNLVQTVPPKGVDRLKELDVDHQAINSERLSPSSTPLANSSGVTDVIPVHKLQTQYKYNSLNQLVWQQTPDGGISEFAYDVLGRLAVSQNAKQKIYDNISYTIYDPLGRIIEVGELTLDASNYSFSNGHLLNGQDEIVALSSASSGTFGGSSVFPINIEDLTTGHSRKEVTVTKYDELPNGMTPFGINYAADNTRNRITAVMYFDEYTTTGTYTGYQSATFYDYDVHGNVKELVQDINDPELNTLAYGDTKLEKNIKYNYDLISGNVKEVSYQENEEDQFIHHYEYDADNRITIAETSKDKINWEKDAKYFYYDHGPLARVEIGEDKVQACDYAYTIQGWLKGVNSENLLAITDQGHDNQTGGINQMNGKDVMGYSLHYFDNDYIGRQGNGFLTLSEFYGVNTPASAVSPLYNGNIKEMYTASMKSDEVYLGTSHTWYTYDQLNRIKTMDQGSHLNHGSPSPYSQPSYGSTYDYDANGNLKSLTRKTPSGSIDNLLYKYIDEELNNQLGYIDDLELNTIGTDLVAQPTTNYAYNAIGELTKDEDSDISLIDWTVTGKVRNIDKLNATDEDIRFEYDAMGNRIIKKLYLASGTISKLYYIRDAQGNVMATYKLNISDLNGSQSGEDNLWLQDREIYGSSRLGTEVVGQIIGSSFEDNLSINDENPEIANNEYEVFTKLVGDKRYELSNHLGNVLQVVSDRKLAINKGAVSFIDPILGWYSYSGSSDNIIDYYSADVISQSDYYPFGWEYPNQTTVADQNTDYRYGFNGMEKDDEVKSSPGTSYTTEFRQYDPRIGRWLSLDPLMANYPDMSPYASFNNNPIYFADPTGLEGEKPKENGSTVGQVKSNHLWDGANWGEISEKDGKFSATIYSDLKKVKQDVNWDSETTMEEIQKKTEAAKIGANFAEAFTLNTDNVLTIMGIGAMPNFKGAKRSSAITKNRKINKAKSNTGKVKLGSGAKSAPKTNPIKIDAIDDDVILFSSKIGDEVIEGTAHFKVVDNKLILNKLHLEGSSAGKIGREQLWKTAKDLGKKFDVDEIFIQGGKRTTGKYKGTVPSPIRIKLE